MTAEAPALARVAAAARKLDATVLPVALDRLERLGESGSGAYAYYAARLRDGSLFTAYDVALAARLLECLDMPRLVHEVGSGFGSLSMLLVDVGFSAVCFELDPGRQATAEALWQVLEGADRDLVGRVRLVHGRFPDQAEHISPHGAVAVATNLITTASSAARSAMIAAFATYAWTILDVDRFLVPAPSPQTRGELIRELEAAACKAEPFLEVGRNVCFWRFLGPQPLAGP